MAFVALSFVASAGYVRERPCSTSPMIAVIRENAKGPSHRVALSARTGTFLIPLLLLAGLLCAPPRSDQPCWAWSALYFVATPLPYSPEAQAAHDGQIDLHAGHASTRSASSAGGVAIGADLSVWLLAVSIVHVLPRWPRSSGWPN